MLLERNYFKQIRIPTDKGVLDFRLSIPRDMNFADVMDRKHDLRPPRLLLQDTQQLDAVVAELFLGSSTEFDGKSVKIIGNSWGKELYSRAD